MNRIDVYPYHDRREAIDTTSRSKSWSRGLSPFVLGPCALYDGLQAANCENAWQYSKVYPEHDEDGRPSPEYFRWAREGWSNRRAVRYPMGKGKPPLYSWWDGEKLDYVAARKRIYIPLYAAAVRRTAAFRTLQSLHEGGAVALRDFDGYDYHAQGLSLSDVVNDPRRKMGHAFVLALLLTPAERWDARSGS